jgi:hypothetical protein
MSDLRTNALIARGMGIVFIAGGFMLGIYGLEFPTRCGFKLRWGCSSPG